MKNKMNTLLCVVVMAALFSGCGGGGDDQGNGVQQAPRQSQFSVEREFLFDNTENVSLSPVTLATSGNGLGGCEASGVLTNVSVETCENIFVSLNALDKNGIVIAQSIDLVRDIPSSTGARFGVDIVTSTGFVACDEIDDLTLDIDDKC